MIYCFFFLPELGQHLSGLIWAVMLVSAAIVITLPRESGVRTFVASTILRMIFSVGPEPTLITLGTITVSHVTVLYLKDKQQNRVTNIIILRMRYGPRSCRWAGRFEVSSPVVLWSCMQMVFRPHSPHIWGYVGQFVYCFVWEPTGNRTMLLLSREVSVSEVYTGWSKNLYPPNDHSTKNTQKYSILNSFNHLPQ